MLTRGSVVAVVVGTEDNSARFIWNKKTGKKSKCSYNPDKGVKGSYEECILLTAAHVLEQYIGLYDEGKFSGKIALVVPHSVHLRMCQVRGLYVKEGLKDAGEIVEEIVNSCSWDMTEAHQKALLTYTEQFVQFMGEDRLDTCSYDSNTLEYWEVVGSGEGSIEDGMEITLRNGETEDGEISCENNAVSGTFTAEMYNTRRNGKASIGYRIPRAANPETNTGRTLINIRKMWANAMLMLPQIEVFEENLADIEESEDVG